MAILITGCSSGIGKETACYLKQQGMDVIASARKQAAVDQLMEQGLKAIQLDLDSDESIANAVSESVRLSDNGRIDVLVNNAGFGQVGALEDLTRDAMRAQFETNVFGLQMLTNQVVPHMRQHNQGLIIHVSSILGLVSLPFSGAYNASKHAVEALADTLRLELSDSNIKVVALQPGHIESSFRENCLDKMEGDTSVVEQSRFQTQYQRQIAVIKNKTPTPGMKRCIDVAKLIHKVIKHPNPKASYKVTLPAHILAFIKRLLPTRGFNWLMRGVAYRDLKAG